MEGRFIKQVARRNKKHIRYYLIQSKSVHQKMTFPHIQ